MTHFEIVLKAQPTEIKKAVKGLEKPRRTIPKIRLSYEDFIKEIPKIPLAKFEKMKLKKSAQELLPYVLVELADNPDQRNKLFALIKAKFSKFSTRTRFRILAFGLSYPEIRKIGYLYFSNNAPDEKAPRWVRTYWKEVLRPEDPIERIVQILMDHKVPIVHALSWLEINPCIPSIDGLFLSYLPNHTHALLRSCPFWDVYRFIQSSAPELVRTSILIWVLNTYSNDWSERAKISQAYQQVLTYAIREWGNPQGAQWQMCRREVVDAALWLYTEK
jgi:hypothetical protein